MPDTTRRGVWDLQEVRDQILNSEWEKTFELWAWGANTNGILGQNNTTPYSSPVQIPGNTWSSIDTGNNFTLATKTDGTLWSWGYNQYGQLGQNSTYTRQSPVQIPGTTWSSVAAGDFAAGYALKTDGTLWSWGLSSSGSLGLNDGISRSSPTQIPGNTWTSIAAGSTFAAATKTYEADSNIKELWVWGTNNQGELGLNDRTNYSSPRQIPGNTWSSVSAAGGRMYGFKTNGTLWAWGANSAGQLGFNDRIARSSPTQIPGNTWSFIGASTNHALAFKTDGTLWAWGTGNSGQLGQNNTISYSSPVQIPGLTWSSISAGYHSLATKYDGQSFELWAWGGGTSGQFGLNDTIPRSSPTQIPGNTWSSVISASSNSSYVIKTPIV